jgi:hypothetical protein
LVDVDAAAIVFGYIVFINIIIVAAPIMRARDGET